MRMLTTTLLAAAVGLSLLPTARAADPAPIEIDAQFDPAAAAATAVKASDPQALKGLKRAAITQFNVEFVTSDNVSSETSGFAMAGRASVTGYYKLVGVAEPDFQAIADQLYAGFQQQLQAAGLELVPAAELAGSPTYRKLQAGGTVLPERSSNGVTVGPPGMAVYGLNQAQAADGKKGMFAALSGLSAGISAVGGAMDNMTLSKELGDAALLEVSMRVHFAQLTNEAKGFFGRLGSTAKVSAKLHPMVPRAALTVQSGAYVSVLTLQGPALLDPAAFVELREEAATAGDIAGAVAVGLLQLASGSKNSHSSTKYEAVADATRYSERVSTGLSQVNALLIARMVAGR
ncbi:hypothetical protein ACG02S_19135 [Roseateles sp. DC23W]|uniref:Uncharacterized protein n=1 Tax=Pelomonas dachongensis TaxID=3299029 RepID=A0ABW7EUU6_9BURK